MSEPTVLLALTALFTLAALVGHSSGSSERRLMVALRAEWGIWHQTSDI